MTPGDNSTVADRVASVRQRIADAGGKNVELIAVTKTFDVSAMVSAFDSGCDGVGENYAQELIAKAKLLPIEKRLPVHFIGRLQTNKIKALIEVVDIWQSVDRPELIKEIAKRSATAKSQAKIMLQVNSTNEMDKGGCQPAEVEELLRLAIESKISVIGLMTVGPTQNEPELTRQGFRLVRKLADDLGLAQCSMGMTGDLEIAVSEGATMIRVGSALFGARS